MKGYYVPVCDNFIYLLCGGQFYSVQTLMKSFYVLVDDNISIMMWWTNYLCTNIYYAAHKGMHVQSLLGGHFKNTKQYPVM